MFLKSRISAEIPELMVAFLVFSLSTGVLGGVLLYLDSAGPDVLSEMSQQVLIDMEINFHSEFYEQNKTTVESLKQIVLEQNLISKAESISLVQINDPSIEIPEYTRNVVLGIDDSFMNSFPNAIDVSLGSSPLNESNCYVMKSLLYDKGLRIGDNFTISVPTETGYVNRSLKIAGTFESTLYMRKLAWNTPQFPYLHVIMERSTLQHEFDELTHSGDNCLTDRIWVSFDTAKLLAQDPTTVVNSLRHVEMQIEQRTLPDASVTQFKIISVFYDYSTWAVSMRVVSLAFSIPSLIMGFMLIQYNTKLQSDQQRRSIGTLKTRGASGVQAVKWVLSMSIFTGIFGSVGAILAGIGAASFAGGIRELMVFDFERMSYFSILFLPQTLLIVFLFSFIAGFIVSIPSVIGAFIMTPTDAHRIIENEGKLKEEGLGNPVFQVALVGLSGITLIPLLDSLESFTDLSAGSAIMGILIIILLAIFILGFTTLLSRPASVVKSWILLRIKRKSLIVGTRVMGKLSKSFARSEGMAILFISLVFTAGIFSSLSATSGANHMKELFMFSYGADVVVDVKPGLANVTNDMVNKFQTVEGVQYVSAMMITSMRVTFDMEWNGYLYPYNRTMPIIGIQPEDWLKSAFIRPYFTYYENPMSSIPKIDGADQKVITNFKPIIGYSTDIFGNSIPTITDSVCVELLGHDGKHVLNCTIIDVMANNPASVTPSLWGNTYYAADSFLPGMDSIEQFVMFDIDVLQSYLNTTSVNKFYIKLSDEANYTRVMEELGQFGESSFEEISSPLEQIDKILDTRAGQSIYGAYTLNVIFSLLYLSVGITLMVAMKIRNMRRQFSLLRALGTQAKVIITSVMIDSIVAVLLGALIGSLIGVILTLLVFKMPLTFLGLSSSVVWDRLPLMISFPIQLISGLIIIAIGFSLFATFFIIKRNLQTNIANDIQHSE